MAKHRIYHGMFHVSASATHCQWQPKCPTCGN